VKLYGGIHRHYNKFTLVIGYSFLRFGLGFHISRNNVELDLGVIWLGVEW
jgi:hypothetical protein